MEHTAHAPQAVQVTLTPLRNEGYFTLEAKTVFRPYLPSRCRGVIQICNMTLPAHVLHDVQFRLKSVSNEGHFTLEAKQFFALSPLALQWAD
jgi:hypothetical protein